MALEAELRDLMRQSVQIEPWSARGFDGSPSYGPTATYSARIVDAVSIARRLPDTVRDARHVLWLNTASATASAISTTDRLTLPADFDPRQPVILRVSRLPDETGGTHHVVLYC